MIRKRIFSLMVMMACFSGNAAVPVAVPVAASVAVSPVVEKGPSDRIGFLIAQMTLMNSRIDRLVGEVVDVKKEVGDIEQTD